MTSTAKQHNHQSNSRSITCNSRNLQKPSVPVPWQKPDSIGKQQISMGHEMKAWVNTQGQPSHSSPLRIGIAYQPGAHRAPDATTESDRHKGSVLWKTQGWKGWEAPNQLPWQEAEQNGFGALSYCSQLPPVPVKVSWACAPHTKFGRNLEANPCLYHSLLTVQSEDAYWWAPKMKLISWAVSQ